MKYKEVLEFSSANEFISWTEKSELFRIHNGHFAERGPYGGWIFRGQSNSDWELLPSAFRKGSLSNCDPLSSELGDVPDLSLVCGKLACQIQSELKIAHSFAKDVDSLGLQSPIDYSFFSVYEEHINKLWRAQEDQMGVAAEEILKGFPELNIAEMLAFAQHHGVPTRLLDWTENPLIAGFFAAHPHSTVTRLSSSFECKSGKMSIFALKGYHTFLSPDFTRPHFETVRVPHHRNSYLFAQQGLFTLTPNANFYAMKSGILPSLETILENHRCAPELIKINLPITIADDLLKLLFRNGITAYTMMPSLDNAAKAQRYRCDLFNDRR